MRGMPGVAAAALVAALGALACADGIFTPAAPRSPRAELALAATAATDSALFESVDAIRVRVGLGVGALLDSTFAFRSAGRETRVHVALELQNAQEAVYIDVELRTAGMIAFRGTAAATLKQNETTVVPIALIRVAAAALPVGATAPAAGRRAGTGG